MDRRLKTHPPAIPPELEREIDRRLEGAFQSAQHAFTACSRAFYGQSGQETAQSAIPENPLELGAGEQKASCHCGR
jgi:hypothetical protein